MTTRPLHAVLVPPAENLATALREALRGGPAILPLSRDLPTTRLNQMLSALRPHAIVEPNGNITPLPDPVPCAPDTAAVIVTSGSTGEPKGVELSAEALRWSAAASLEYLDAGPDDTWLCCVPPVHIAGVQVFTRAFTHDKLPIVHEKFDPTAVMNSGAQFTAVVSTMLYRILNTPIGPSPFRALLLGGGPITDDLRRQAALHGLPLVGTYGMTETCGGCVYEGHPLQGIEMRVDDEQRIYLRGPVLASSYRLRPDLTADVFKDGWLRTEDLGRIGDDGRLQILGRADWMIVTGGKKVHPEQVENLLAAHPAIGEVAVIGQEDQEWGERVIAFMTLAPGMEPPATTELREWVSDHAERWLAPREFRIVEQLPRLPSGKINRGMLKKLIPME